MFIRSLIFIALSTAIGGCASTLEYTRTDPRTGHVEQRTYKIGYGNEISDSVAGVSVRPSPAVTAAGERLALYGVQHGGETLMREALRTAQTYQQPN